MQILQVTKKFPFPVRDGEAVAVGALARGLRQAGCRLDLLSFNTSKHYLEDPEGADLPHYDQIATCELYNDVTYAAVAVSLLRRGSYHVERFDSAELRIQLKTMLQLYEYDAVILETTILARYIDTVRKFSNAVVVVRAHNLEYEIWDRVADRQRWPARWVYRELARRLKNFERTSLPAADLLLPITARDADSFQEQLDYQGALHTVPVGYELDPVTTARLRPLADLKRSISFIGSLDWAPNLEGLNWFLKEVWPLLHAADPELEFHIAGRKTPDSIAGLGLDQVVVHGEVADSSAFLAAHPLTVAPILSGSGIRVKILEAMAQGRVVLATPMGLEGLQVQDRQTVLVCDQPTDFVRQLAWLYEDTARLASIGLNAVETMGSNFDLARIGLKLAARITDCRRNRAVVSPPR